jgi:hypothetical protein
MGWVKTTADYFPAAGEKVRVIVSPITIPVTVSPSDIRSQLESFGIAVVDVSKPLFGSYYVELIANGNQSMREIGQQIKEAIDDMWQAFSTRIEGYEKWQAGFPTPPTNWTVSLVAIAIIAVVLYLVVKQLRLV